MSVKARLAAFTLGLLLAVSAGATTFPLFGPVSGVLKGSASSPITTAATSADIIGLWSGSCSVSTILRGDGTCASPVSSFGAALTKVDDTNVTLTLGGTPSTALLSASSLTLGWTGTLAASRGGLGMSTVTDDTVAVANGSTWQSKAITDCDSASSALTYDTTANAWGCNTISGATPAAMTRVDDTNVTLTLGGTPATSLLQATSLTMGWTGTLAASRGGLGMSTVTDDTVAVANGSTWQSKALTDCDAATSAVTYDTTTNAWGCNTINGATGANPTGTVGLSAVNGVATTFLRSDGAPALSQSIVPTWSGQHTFSQPVLHANGTTALPGMSFTSDPDTGLYRAAADDVRLSAGGVDGLITQSTALFSQLPHNFVNGSVSDLSIRFGNDTDTGLYRVGADDIAIAAGGAQKLRIGTAFAYFNGVQVWTDDGTAPAPAYAFTNDIDTGIYRLGSNQLGMATGGTRRAYVFDTGLVSEVAVRVLDGSAGAPQYTFDNDTDTGRYRVSADKMCDSTGGTCRVTIGPGVLVGTATGGDQGAGTVNATGLYVNGVSVTAGAAKSAYAYIDIGGGGCAVSGAPFTSVGVSSCARGSTGEVNVTVSGFTTRPVCTATFTAGASGYSIQAFANSTTNVLVTTQDASNAPAFNFFNITCFGT